MADARLTRLAPTAVAAGAGAEPALAGEPHTRNHLGVVFVCTGNRFRSPIAESLLRRLAGGVPLTVSSVGVVDLGSRPALDEALALSDRLGIDLRRHRTTPLAKTALAESDLVLGFEHAHVAAAVIEAGAPRSRAFTLPEFVHLLPRVHVGPLPALERARRVVEAADRLRSVSPPLRAPELADPLGCPPEVYRGTADQIAALVADFVRGLFPAAVAA